MLRPDRNEKFKNEITAYLTEKRNLNPNLEPLISEGLKMVKDRKSINKI